MTCGFTQSDIIFGNHHLPPVFSFATPVRHLKRDESISFRSFATEESCRRKCDVFPNLPNRMEQPSLLRLLVQHLDHSPLGYSCFNPEMLQCLMHDFNMLLINNAEIAELMQRIFCVLCIEWKDIFSSNKCTIAYFITF